MSKSEYELNQMGLSVDDLQPPSGGRFDRRAMARVESAQIMSRRFIERDRVRDQMQLQQSAYRQRLRKNRQTKAQSWRARTQHSPFLVDLVAENERADEENRVRLREEARRARVAAMRMERAKNDIILQALTEDSDLDALRREKRAILEEERRLKALLDIEKTQANRKMQVLAAHRAEKQRHAAKGEYRRRQFTAALENHYKREADVLAAKLEVPPRPDTTFTSFGSR